MLQLSTSLASNQLNLSWTRQDTSCKPNQARTDHRHRQARPWNQQSPSGQLAQLRQVGLVPQHWRPVLVIRAFQSPFLTRLPQPQPIRPSIHPVQSLEQASHPASPSLLLVLFSLLSPSPLSPAEQIPAARPSTTLAPLLKFPNQASRCIQPASQPARLLTHSRSHPRTHTLTHTHTHTRRPSSAAHERRLPSPPYPPHRWLEVEQWARCSNARGAAVTAVAASPEDLVYPSVSTSDYVPAFDLPTTYLPTLPIKPHPLCISYPSTDGMHGGGLCYLF